ncbi:hypothetical protein Tco_1529985, partial [Tanacetum coccineum]
DLVYALLGCHGVSRKEARFSLQHLVQMIAALYDISLLHEGKDEQLYSMGQKYGHKVIEPLRAMVMVSEDVDRKDVKRSTKCYACVAPKRPVIS